MNNEEPALRDPTQDLIAQIWVVAGEAKEVEALRSIVKLCPWVYACAHKE
jgi:hypothetical protein